jgi:hypothetical protein
MPWLRVRLLHDSRAEILGSSKLSGVLSLPAPVFSLIFSLQSDYSDGRERYGVLGRAQALEAGPLGDKTMLGSQNSGIDDAQAQLIHPEPRVSHRVPALRRISILWCEAPPKPLTASFLRLRSRIDRSQVLPSENRDCFDLCLCPSDDSADAAGVAVVLLHSNRSSRRNRIPIYLGNLWAARARALAISSVRLRGGAFVSSELRKLQETFAILSTAARNAASLAFDGLLKPLTFLTNCKEAARISSSVTGGSKLKRVRMLLHTIVTSIFQSCDTKVIRE